MILLSYLNFFALLLLSLLHFHWGLGGDWGFESALPTNDEGERVLNPKPLDSLVVGFGLMLFASFHLIRTGIVELPLPNWMMHSGLWMIGGIFLLRAMGDFKYIGFYKKVTATPFAEKDSKFYSPLCLGIGVVAVIIEILMIN